MPDLEFRRAQRDGDLLERVLERREKRVSFHLAQHDAEIQVGAAREELRVDFRAADDPYFARGEARGIERGEVARPFRRRGFPRRVR